ncbi:MAG: ABC-F family ATP-binding cassette domain-containing protein [Bacteroidales bacterium]|nr:ABC-F family ATP-binding cassette domain-containing protein [Bacteroidales bacterium]
MASAIQIEGLSKYIGELILFEEVDLLLNIGEKAAIIGNNGAGKTTLLNIIAGKDSKDKGSCIVDSNLKIKYLLQNPEFHPELTVMESVYQSDNEHVRYIKDYEKAIMVNNIPEIEKTASVIDKLRLWDYEHRIKQLLTQLNIMQFDQKVKQLSGGQIKRLALANALIDEPDLLILDEPTNHLDLDVIEWLEGHLQKSSLTLLMVTHDRFFLDRICNTIFEIDMNRIYRYDGNYSKFIKKREQRIANDELEVEKSKNLLRKEEDWMHRMPKARSSKAKYRIDNYHGLVNKAGQKRTYEKVKINIHESRLGKKILVAKNLNFKWNDQYYIKDFSYTFSRFEKIGIIGKNGTGKSTLLGLLTENLKHESGIIEKGETVKFGYYKQEGIQFDDNIKVLDAVASIAESIKLSDGNTITASQFLNYFLFPFKRQHDYISKLSGGEKRRLYLCQLLMTNPNFLVLDEPTNDLDIATLQVLEDYLSLFNGCVLVVSHDRYFMDHVVDHLFVFKEKAEIKDFPGNYSQYFLSLTSVEKKAKTQNKIKKDQPVRIIKENRLSYKEKREFELLESEIEKLENEKMEIEKKLSSEIEEVEQIRELSERIAIIINELDEKSDRWLELSEKI